MAHDNAFFKPNSRASRIRRLIRGRLVHESPRCPVAIAARTHARTHSRSQRRAPKRGLISQGRNGVCSAGFSVGKAMLKGTHRCTVRVSSCWPVIAFHLFFSLYPFYDRAVSWSGEAAACLCQVSVSVIINASLQPPTSTAEGQLLWCLGRPVLNEGRDADRQAGQGRAGQGS